MNERGKVLIVDDEPEVAGFIQELLRNKSYAAETALNGQKALAFLEAQPADILITDIRMPGMNGLELIKHAKQLQPDISCMVITGHGDMDTAVQAIKFGAVNFFTKPLDCAELEKVIDNEMDSLLLMQERRQQQQQIAEFYKKLGKEIRKNQAILHAAGQGIVGLDEQGEITFINPAALDILGWERNELIACSFAKLVGRDEAEDVFSLPATPLGHRRFLSQSFFKQKDGRIVPVEYVKSKIVDDESEGSVLIFEDITGRQIQQEKLAQAKIVAEEANQSKSHFLARISHEIRTPLNTILGISELLLASPLDTRQKQFCETMLHSGRSLLQLINDVLDVSKIEAGKLELNCEDFDLEQLIEHSLETVAEDAAQKNLGLAYRIEVGVDRLLVGDSYKLKQIMVNLLANAVKFTEQGEVTVRVRSIDTTLLHFAVQDTGIGIQQEAQEHIFDSFTQADAATSGKFGGTGLGLTIVRHLAARMSGDCGFSSSPGKGSEFWFTASFSRQPGEKNKAAQGRAPLAGLRVLIIDSYPLSRRFLQEQMEDWQVDSESTDRITECQHLLLQARKANKHFDVILLDSRAMNGAETESLQSMQGCESVTETPVILFTATNENAQHIADIAWPARIVEERSNPVHLDTLYNILFSLCNPGETNPVLEEQRSMTPEVSPCHFDARILMVDDNPTNQLVIGEMLALTGCRPDMANNGREALTMLAQDEYDLIFMDCQMPEMDGFEATRHIRTNKSTTNRHIPIIAMTAKALQGDRENCLATGMDDYLSKPFTRNKLHQILNTWLPDKSATGSLNCTTVTCTKDELQKKKTNSPVRVDFSMLERLRTLQEESGTNMLEELFTYFAGDAPRTIEFLSQAIENQEWKSLNAEAHRFKSSCANLGAESMVLLCHSLQKFDDCSQKKAMELLQSLRREYQAVKRILAQETP